MQWCNEESCRISFYFCNPVRIGVLPLRSSRIAKGMLWSPTHGDTNFTAHLFDAFMKRIMPGNNWQDIL